MSSVPSVKMCLDPARELTRLLSKYRGCEARIKCVGLTRDELRELYYKTPYRKFLDPHKTLYGFPVFLEYVKLGEVYFRGTKLAVRGEKP